MSSSITSFAGFLTEVVRVLDGEETNITDMPVASLTRFLRVAEKRIYRDVRSRWNEKAFSAVTSTGNLAPIPTDFKAASVVHVGGAPLKPVAEQWLDQYLEAGASGECLYFAEAGPSFKFGPALTDGTAVQGRYFYELAALSDATIATHALFQEADDLFIFATLSECAVYFNKAPMLELWEAKYQSIVAALNGASRNAAFSVGRIQRKPSTLLMR